MFFAHGAQKVFGWFGGPGLKATIQAFQQYMKIPPAATVLAAFIECFGGLALIIGVLARPAALGLIVVMLVAVAKVHWQHGFFINFPGTPGKGHGFEFNFVLLMMRWPCSSAGAGAAVDRPRVRAARRLAVGFVVRVLVNAAMIWLAAQVVPGISAARRLAHAWWPASCSD